MTHILPEQATVPAPAPLHLPPFRMLWAGWSLIAFAIQFYAVVLIWLVLHVTGSGLQLSSVLIAAAVPRALTMLLSGAIIDRVAPQQVLVVVTGASAVLVGIVAALLQYDALASIHLYVLAALLGLMDAFFYPAATAQLVRLVDRSRLQQANGLFQTADNAANILGPAAGGFIIGAVGLTNAFWMNTALFALGAVFIARMGRQSLLATAAAIITPPGAADESFVQSLRAGFRFSMRSPVIRTSLLAIAAMNFGAFGPVVVGGVALVQTRFGGDAAQYGVLLAVFGIGSLLGGFSAGILPPIQRPGRAIAVSAIVLGGGLGLIGVASSTWTALFVHAVMGVGVGLMGVVATTWLQSHTPSHMQGRVSSLLMFAMAAVDPFSNTVAGALIDTLLTALFIGSGVFLGCVGLVMWWSTALYDGTQVA